MKVEIKPGKYVVAVSGGVDSVVLLDLLNKKKDLKIVVAHFDHGIRPDSAEDKMFVEKLAKNYGLGFYYEGGNLGSTASEATAREARYKFLRKILRDTSSEAIITAHHEDDLIETAIINLLRGTTAKGLGALKSTDEIRRPLINYKKTEIIKYATENNLTWRDDQTNKDEKYLRNYVRLNIASKLTNAKREKLLEIIKKSSNISDELSQLTSNILPESGHMGRAQFAKMSHSVAMEFLASWLDANHLSVDKKTLERLVVALKTAKTHTAIDINKNHAFSVKNGEIKLIKVGSKLDNS